MEIKRRSTKHPNLVLMECHCGDKFFANTAETGRVTCINGHSAHFPTLHRKWLPISGGY